MKNNGHERGKPYLPNLVELIKAGIDPVTGLPLKMGDLSINLKEKLKTMFDIIDEQTAVNRFEWYNLPTGITGEELERILFFRGQVAFFLYKDLDEYYFMPYALDGTIDFYGRFNTIHPVPFTSGVDEKKDEKYKEEKARQNALLSQLKLKCIYKVQTEDSKIDKESCCVLLHDYSKPIGEHIIPRHDVNQALIDVMSDVIPFLRTTMLSGTGVRGYRVNSQDEQLEVQEGAKRVYKDALKGTIWEPIIGNIEFQDLVSKGGTAKLEEYLMALQSLDNIRKSTYGIENGGSFEKKAHTLESEEQINQSNNSFVMEDSLKIRQNFCDIVNSIWNLGIWVEKKETQSQDMNLMQPNKITDNSNNNNNEGENDND